jgi:hypothetical protein
MNKFVPEEIPVLAAVAWIIGMPPREPELDNGIKFRLRKRKEETDKEYEERDSQFWGAWMLLHGAITLKEVEVREVLRHELMGEPLPDGEHPVVELCMIKTSSLRKWAEKNGYSLGEDAPEKLLAKTNYSPKLKLLIQAACKFWENADPLDCETQPTNKTVSEWLQKQGLSERLANAGAAFISPEWVKKGRRPQK